MTHLITALILPPGVFFVLLAAGLIWGGRHRWARWLAAGSLVAFVLLSLNVVAYALVRQFEERWPALEPAIVEGLATAGLAPEPAAIVVLGGGRTLGALEYPERETLGAASSRRAIYAAQLSQRMGLPLAVSGGKPGGGVLGEAELMRRLLENGLRQTVMLVEDASLDTRQNALFTAQALARWNIRTVVLVTDVTHMPRATRAFQAAGLKVVPAPVNFLASSPLQFTDFLPSMGGLELSRNVLRELVGTLWYAIREAFGP